MAGVEKKARRQMLIALTILIIAASVLWIITYKKTIPVDNNRIYLSSYEKIRDGAPINMLIVGDSIAQGTGATNGNSWANLLTKWITDKCGDKSVVTNVSMGGNTSYAGIVREKILDDGKDYDFAIICYGENDIDDETFAP